WRDASPNFRLSFRGSFAGSHLVWHQCTLAEPLIPRGPPGSRPLLWGARSSAGSSSGGSDGIPCFGSSRARLPAGCGPEGATSSPRRGSAGLKVGDCYGVGGPTMSGYASRHTTNSKWPARSVFYLERRLLGGGSLLENQPTLSLSVQSCMQQRSLARMNST